MNTPAEFLAIPADVLRVDKPLATYRSIKANFASPSVDLYTQVGLRAAAAADLCLLYYLRGDWNGTLSWGNEVLAATEDYFFGDWRDRTQTDDGIIDPDWWWYQSPANWTDKFANGLVWSAVCSNWSAIGRLMKFPHADVKPDLDGKLVAEYYKALAVWWNNEMDVTSLRQVKQIRGGGSKEIYQRCEILEAIACRDLSGLTATFTAHLKQWIKTKKDCPQRLPVDATFLWHIARKHNMKMELPQELQRQLIIIPDAR